MNNANHKHACILTPIRHRNKSLLQQPQTTNLSNTRKSTKFHTPETKKYPPKLTNKNSKGLPLSHLKKEYIHEGDEVLSYQSKINFIKRTSYSLFLVM
jgi:hypothetical protein